MGQSVEMLKTAKHIDELSRIQYGDAMASSVKYKAQFFQPMIERFLPSSGFPQGETCQILDLGSCTSSLALQIASGLPQKYHFIECDLDMHFLETGKEKLRSIPQKHADRFTHIQANVVQLPIADESMDAVMHSSFFHEIFSFPVTDAGPFNKENCHQLVREIRRVLKPGGYVFGRDYVARPENPNELLLLEADQTNGLVVDDVGELLSAPVEGLSSFSAAQRFLHQFEPAQGMPVAMENGYITLPAWLAAELFFHFSYRGSSHMWNSEIHELYGDSSGDDLREMAINHGFEPILSQSISHYDIGTNTGMTLTDTAGNPIDTRTRFPTNTYLIWMKKE